VLKDIADEECVHAGGSWRFLRLLRELAPDEEKFYAEGAKEVEEEIGIEVEHYFKQPLNIRLCGIFQMLKFLRWFLISYQNLTVPRCGTIVNIGPKLFETDIKKENHGAGHRHSP
jgi:hypothetical protein